MAAQGSRAADPWYRATHPQGPQVLPVLSPPPPSCRLSVQWAPPGYRFLALPWPWCLLKGSSQRWITSPVFVSTTSSR